MSRKYRLFGLLLLAALLLSACQPVVAQPQAPPSDEEATAAVNAIWDEYEASLLAGDVDRWIAQWMDDGVQMPPDMPPRVGKETIYAAVSGFLSQYDYTDFVIDNEDAVAVGDLAFARGTYAASFAAKSGGDPVSVEGKYMTILRQQVDGSWKIYRDIFNSNVPPAAPPSADATDVDAATEAIKALWEEYSASALAGDPERRLALWAEDGIQMPPDREARFGIDTIRAATEAGMANVVTNEYAVIPEEVQVFGDLAFARGTYSANRTPVSGGNPIQTDGKFMTILQRQADGSWKIYRDIFNSNVPPAPATAPTTDPAEVAAAIDAVWREYEASQIAGDPDRWIALWAEDGVQLPPGSPPVVGKEAIDARDRSDLEVNDYSQFVITNREVEVNGDLAFARGDFMVTVAPKSGGDPMDFEGKYMTIFRRQPDGSWKIYRDIFNPSAPSEPEAADSAALSAELHQRFSDNDLEGAAALADENIRMVGFGLGLDLEGREQFLNFMKARKRAFPDITLQHTNKVVQGDQVVVEFVATGTHLGPLITPNGEVEATGKPVTLNVVEIHTWKDGKLVNLVQYQDPTSPLKQIGVMK